MLAIIVLTFAAPYVIVPLFFKPQPVDDPGVVMMIEDLVRQAGTTVAGVSRLDFSRRTNEANAAVIGFGRSRRVVLADTLLSTFTPSEIKAVVAHELGHHVHRDVPKLMAMQAITMLVGLALATVVGDPLLRLLGAAPMSDPISYPLLTLGVAIFGIACLPVVNAYARSVEADADAYAFDLLGEDGRSRRRCGGWRTRTWLRSARRAGPACSIRTHRSGDGSRGRRQHSMAKMLAPSWIGPGLLMVFVVPLLVYGAYSIGDRWYQNYILTRQEESIRVEVLQLREENLRLQKEELNKAKSDSGIEKTAREQLGLIRPGDTAIQLVGPPVSACARSGPNRTGPAATSACPRAARLAALP